LGRRSENEALVADDQGVWTFFFFFLRLAEAASSHSKPSMLNDAAGIIFAGQGSDNCEDVGHGLWLLSAMGLHFNK
jgi:hypothetical protein